MAKARILVVDDDSAVLRLVAKVLQGAGYDIVTATGPRHALEIITILGGFDVVVSDVVMPEMCGPELAGQIRLRSPSSAILLMSGCTLTGNLADNVPFIGKPFAAKDLLRAVDRLLQPPNEPAEA